MLDAHLLLELGEKMVWDFQWKCEREGWLAAKVERNLMSTGSSGGGRQRRAGRSAKIAAKTLN